MRIHEYLREMEQLLSAKALQNDDHPAESTSIQLFKNMVASYNLSELKELCFDLNDVEYENLPGETKNGIVISLIQFYEKHKKIQKLVDYLKKRQS